MTTRIDFNQFRVKNPDFRGAFEDLCYHLFCREFGASSGVKADFNEAGLETKPILHKGKNYRGPTFSESPIAAMA